MSHIVTYSCIKSVILGNSFCLYFRKQYYFKNLYNSHCVSNFITASPVLYNIIQYIILS